MLLCTTDQPVMSAPIDIYYMPKGAESADPRRLSCPYPQCRREFIRPKDFKRHIIQKHLPDWLYCQQPDCNWTGNRRYMLERHLSDEHSGQCSDVPMPEFMIYDANVLLDLLSSGSDVKDMVGGAQSLFQMKAVRLGKLGTAGWWNWACPFSKCSMWFNQRPQFVQHIPEHLPYHIYCEQQGCN